MFDPGEGLDEACLPPGAGWKNGINLGMEGVSAFVFEDDDSLPEGCSNQFNDPSAYNVYLYR